jgi:hypothetical protein
VFVNFPAAVDFDASSCPASYLNKVVTTELRVQKPDVMFEFQVETPPAVQSVGSGAHEKNDLWPFVNRPFG